MASFNERHDTIFMKNIYTMVSSFRHTPEIERALQKAMEEKKCSKAHIIYCCLTGEENLNRYLNEFDEEDLKWCYEQRLQIFRDRREKTAAMEAIDGHEKVNAAYAKKLSAKK